MVSGFIPECCPASNRNTCPDCVGIRTHWGINQLGVAVALVRSDFFTSTLRQRHGLAWVLKLDFSKHETSVLPGKLVHLSEDP
jgi:hypothetical protein